MVLLLFEQRPAVLVQRLLVERRIGAVLDYLVVGSLGFVVALLHEQRLAAAKLRLVDVHRLRVLRDELVERGERVVEPPLCLVGARELIEHEVVLLVVRIRLEQLLVHPDRAAEVVTERLNVALQLDRVGVFELQVGQAAHRFGAQQRIVGREVEKQTVALHGLGLAAIDRSRPVDFDDAALERLDGARGISVVAVAMPERPDRGDREQRGQRGAHLAPSASTEPAAAGATRAAARS